MDSDGNVKIKGYGEMYNSSEEKSFWGYCSDSIKSVDIENGITYIGEYSFYNCSTLSGITIPESVESVGNYAFYNCTSLSQINWNARNCADFHYASSIFYNAGQNIDGINVVFGDMVERIPAFLFHSGGKKITNITIGRNVKSIGSCILQLHRFQNTKYS